MMRRASKSELPAARARQFADVLRRLRVERGISQEALALECGLHRTYISQLERGLKSPSLKTMVALCDVLGVSLSAFSAILEEQPRKR